MKSVILISSEQLSSPDLLDAYGRIGTAYEGSPGRVVVEGDWGWFAVATRDDVEAGLDDDERIGFADRLGAAHYAQLEFSSEAALRHALRALPASGKVLVDDDHGAVEPIEDFRAKVSGGVTWTPRPSKAAA